MNQNVLLSYFYLRGVRLAGLPAGSKLFIDSGAFSAAASGVPVRLAEYISWLKVNAGVAAMYASLDVIDDPKKTERNLQIMRDEGLSPVPVFHVSSAIEHFDRLVKQRPPIIAIGGMVPYLQRSDARGLERKLAEVFDRADGVPLHGFGVGTRDLAFSLPWRSCDASLLRYSHQYATLFEYDRRQRRLLFFQETAGKARVSRGVDGEMVGQPLWRARVGQMRIAQKYGVRRRELVEIGSAKARDMRLGVLVREVGEFVAHVREEREFDFYFACGVEDVPSLMRCA